MMRFLRRGRDTLQRTYSGAGKAFSFLTLEVRGLQAAAYILALSSLASSILALLRDRLLAFLFGAGSILDVYYAAFRIPDIVFIGAGALVSAYILIPELSKRSEEGQRSYLDTIIGGFALLVIVVSAVAAFVTPQLLTWTFPTLMTNGSMAGESLVTMTRILLLQAALLGFSNIAAAITQFKHRYALYALSPIVYNLGIMFGAVALYPKYGLAGLVSGVVFGALLHLAIQLPPIIREGYARQLLRLPDLWVFWSTIRLSVPRALALSMNQLAFFGLLALAATLPAGSIAVFMFAFNLQGVPLAIIGASYATAAFPILARAYSEGQSDAFRMQISVASRQILFWSLPALALLVVLRAHVVRVVLGAGAFDWTDTRLTAAALALFALSLPAQGLSLLLIRALYAGGKTFVPFVVSAISASLTLFLGVAYLKIVQITDVSNFLDALLRVEDVQGTDVLVLAFAYSIAVIVGALILALYVQIHFGSFFSSIRRSFWEGFAAALVGGAGAYATLQVLGDITLSSTLLSILLKGTLGGVVGILMAAITYFVLGSREYTENALALRRRIWKNVEPIASGEEGA